MSNSNKNPNQIIRKDGRNCFVEIKNDQFGIGKFHLEFASYDVSRAAGERFTNHVHIYVDAGDFLALTAEAASGVLLRLANQQKAAAAEATAKGQKYLPTPLFECMGGTSAAKLARFSASRPDGKSLSRICRLLPANKTDFLLSAVSGPGEENKTGLIVPKYVNNKPENSVSISLSARDLTAMLTLAKAHYDAWLSAGYVYARFATQDAATSA